MSNKPFNLLVRVYGRGHYFAAVNLLNSLGALYTGLARSDIHPMFIHVIFSNVIASSSPPVSLLDKSCVNLMTLRYISL